MNTYVSAEGIPFNEDDIERWVADAEAGFPNSEFIAVEGRPWEAKTEPMEAHTIRIPRVLWDLVETQAAKRGISASEYTRNALTRQLAGA